VGSAYLRTSLGESEAKDYEIKIRRVSPNAKNPSKGMIIEVTDETLLQKTGGIVQGMSGSPILQNGKIVGAVTHVLVNNPSMGYAIFAESMMEEDAK
jgi:stage IV sporulation protein B